MVDYNPSDDAKKSYDLAIEAKRERGDTHWPDRLPYRRKEVIGDCTLYLGDCMEIMPTLGKFDAVLTDPPYGISIDVAMNKSSGTKHGVAMAAKRHYEAKGWDSAPPPQEFFDELRSVSRHQIIFGGNYFGLPAARCWLVWDKKVNGEFADCELAWTNLDKPVRRIEWMWNGMLRKGNEARFDHPTQKPLGVMEWCLSHVPDAHTVLDPFLGSGTTGVACVKQGRVFTGIEIDKDYFELACERIRKAYAQPDMFVQAAPVAQPKQEPLL